MKRLDFLKNEEAEIENWFQWVKRRPIEVHVFGFHNSYPS